MPLRFNGFELEAGGPIPDIRLGLTLAEILGINTAGWSKLMKLLNAFSLNMISAPAGDLWFRELGVSQVRSELAQDLVSCVGHADTAAVFSDVLGVPVACARVTVAIEPGETVLVGQYVGPRLAEGTTTLPAGSTIKWILVGLSKE